MSFRKTSVVICDCGRYVVRAGRGLGDELLPAPTIEIQARVGMRKDAMQVDSSSLKQSRFLVGPALDAAETAGEELDIFWPFKDGPITLWAQTEAILRYVLFTALQLRRTQNEFPIMLSLLPSQSRIAHERITQVCFERLNVTALAIFDRPLLQLYAANSTSGFVIDIGRDTTDVTPIVGDEVYHSGCIAVPVGLSDCETYLVNILKGNEKLITQLNTPTELSMEDLERALFLLVQNAWETGIITTPTLDGYVPLLPTATGPGTEGLVDENEGSLNIGAVLAAGKEKAVIEAAANEKKKKTAQEKKAAASALEKERAALDLVDVEFTFIPRSSPTDDDGEPGSLRTVTATLGRERHHFAELLFDPTLLLRQGASSIDEARRERIARNPIGVPEAVRLATAAIEPALRVYLWGGGVLLTGDNNVKSIEAALQSRLVGHLTKDWENAAMPQTQPTANYMRMLKLPEYFAEFRDKGQEMASFLGASIVAKLIFTDSSTSKSYVAKLDYAEEGPTAIREYIK